MRDIKFRVWSIGRKKWLNDCMFDMQIQGAYDFSSDSSMRYNYKTDVVVEQYTGFQDSKGNKIYDGDVVNIRNDGYADVMAQVIFDIAAFWLYSEDIFLAYSDEADNMIRLSTIYMDTGADGYLSQLEVIGNIHENPELVL